MRDEAAEALALAQRPRGSRRVVHTPARLQEFPAAGGVLGRAPLLDEQVIRRHCGGGGDDDGGEDEDERDERLGRNVAENLGDVGFARLLLDVVAKHDDERADKGEDVCERREDEDVVVRRALEGARERADQEEGELT